MSKKAPAKSQAKSVTAYVDAVESAVARVLLQDAHGEWRGYSLPAGILPKGAGEGSWLQLTLQLIPPPEGEAALKLRRRLEKGDDGGDFSL